MAARKNTSNKPPRAAAEATGAETQSKTASGNANGEAQAEPQANGSEPNGGDLNILDLLIKRVFGVGKSIAEQAIADAKLDGKALATREMKDRALEAPKTKAGLAKRALALWVLTGSSDGGIAPEEPAPTTTRSRDEGIPAGTILIYLGSEISGAVDAPLSELPTLDETGAVRVKSTHWEAWLKQNGHADVGRNVATKALRAAGLDAVRWENGPQGLKRWYTGKAPEGLAKDVPVRKDEPIPGQPVAGSREQAPPADPFASVTDDERKVLVKALQGLSIKANRAWGNAEQAKAADELRFALLARLEVKES
jgi:hypothetical protein